MDINSILKHDALTRARDNLYISKRIDPRANQESTNQAFGNKWTSLGAIEKDSSYDAFQKEWFLKLYGFTDRDELAAFLRRHPVILDAGCGLGHKTAWLAELSPGSLVVGMDYSEAVTVAAETYGGLKNLLFLRGDIADTPFLDAVVDFVNCDQVLQHTEDPDATVAEFGRILAPAGELNLYVYAKKALPRELLDDHFRHRAKSLSHGQLTELAGQLTELGRALADLRVKVTVPDIPLLEIKGGEYDLQRFIYWNFLKCFWNEELGERISAATNYDWYCPANAFRYTREEFEGMTRRHGFTSVHLHGEEACHSGRFVRRA